MYEPSLPEPSTCQVHIDVRRSPAQVIDGHLLRGGDATSRATSIGRTASVRACDEALRWLMASDRLISEQASRALCEVKEAKLHLQEGHARWSTYLRAFVPMTPRWCQQEMKRARELRNYAGLAAAYSQGEISKSHLRVILRVVTSDTEEVWRDRGRFMTVRQLEATAREARAGVAAAGEEKLSEEEEAPRPFRRVVMAPPRVAVMVAEAVEVARKPEGYQVGRGQTVAMMAMETMAGLSEGPDPVPREEAAGPSRSSTR